MELLLAAVRLLLQLKRTKLWRGSWHRRRRSMLVEQLQFTETKLWRGGWRQRGRRLVVPPLVAVRLRLRVQCRASLPQILRRAMNKS